MTIALAKSRQTGARLSLMAFGCDVVQAMSALEQRIGQSELETPLVELIRLRVSQINGCAFCIDKHARDARTAGIDDRKLALLSVWLDTSLFTVRERAALAWAEALTRVADGQVPDSAWDQGKDIFNRSQLVDLTLLVTTMNAWNRLAIASRRLPDQPAIAARCSGSGLLHVEENHDVG
jgi:AhpD family alkylhydroperoxidase